MGDNGPVRPALAEELEDFVGRGALWDQEELARLVDRLERESRDTGDPNPSRLAAPLRSLLPFVRDGVPDRTAHDIEAIIYPRMWKIMEAAREGLPNGEVHNRIAVLGRHVDRRLKEEAGS